MYKTEFLCGAFGLLFIISLAGHWKLVLSYTIYKTVNVECLPQPKYVINPVCKLKAFNRYKSLTNMDCDIVKPLTNISVLLKNNANYYKPFLVNVTHNMCDALDKRIFPGYTTTVISILKQVSNVNHSCPYTGHLMVRNLHVDEKYIPITPPLGLYKIVFRFLQGYPYEEIGSVNLYVEAMERKRMRSPKTY